MFTSHIPRREFLATLVGAAGVASFARPAAASSSAAYDPGAKFDVKDDRGRVPAQQGRTHADGAGLSAGGPGALSCGARSARRRVERQESNAPKSRWIAPSPRAVCSSSPSTSRSRREAPYPACVQDANYGVRWLKWKARSWNGDASKVGIYGSSSGGHVAELLAMRPRDPRYNAIPLPDAPALDATVAYVAMRSPISDPYARFKNAEALKREPMINNHKTFFVPWETIYEANPQQILERHEKVTLVPMLIMQGALDDNVRPAVQEKFAATYKAAGGDIKYELFEGSEHEWVATPGPQTDRAREMVKAFIARQLTS